MDNSNISNLIYSQIIENSSMGILVINDSYEIIIWNPSMENFSGITSNKTIGQNFFSIFPELQEIRFVNAIKKSLESGLPFVFSNSLNQFLLPLYGRFPKTPENKIEHSISIIPLPLENNKRYSLIQVTNVTSHKSKEDQLKKQTIELKKIQNELLKTNEELRIKEEQAKQASKAKSYFLSNMSHELRTPLHGILGLIHMMEDELQSGEIAKAKGRIELLNNLGNHLLALVNDILTINKIESGKFELNDTRFELRLQIESVIKTASIKINYNNIELITEFDPALPKYFHGDEVKFRQIIFNLVSNSIKHTEKGYIKIKISYYPNEKENILVQITDTGSGIPPEHQKRIFGMFEQVQDEYNRKFEGAGIGLFITKNLIRLMGGQISFTSSPFNETTFTFSIMLAPCKNLQELSATGTCKLCTAPDNKMTQQRVVPIELLEKKILIVDDNPINIMIMQRHLQNIGFSSSDVAVDGLSTINFYKENDCDLIFLDIQLPDMDGIEVAANIIQLSKDLQKKLPVLVAFTANAIEDALIKYKEVGMVDCLIKPFTTETLIQKLITNLS